MNFSDSVARWIDVHAGDFKQGRKHFYRNKTFFMKVSGRIFREKISLLQITKLERATEASVISLGGAAGWGLAGTVLLGPVGLLAGLILGGRGQNVTFICVLKDGRKFLGTTSSKVFSILERSLLAAVF